MVIDSQASRRQQGGPSNQPQRRPRRGRRRRGTYDETIAPIDTTAMEATDLIRVNSGSTVKDIAEYLGVRGAGGDQEADVARRDGDAHADALRRRHPGARGRVRASRSRSSTPPMTSSSEPVYEDADEDLDRTSAGGHDHGPRRPRQDLAAGRDPRDRGGRGRGGRHHPAHRRLPGAPRGQGDHLPRHARPRGVHGDARARRAA